MPHQVFICYSSDDEAAVLAICHALESNGIPCWYSKRDVKIGQDWKRTVQSAIQNSRIFLLVSSVHANASEPVDRELSRTLTYKVPVLVIRIDHEPINPDYDFIIGDSQWLEAQELPLESHFPQLIEAAKNLINEQIAAEEKRKKAEAARKAREEEEKARKEAAAAPREKELHEVEEARKARLEAEIAEANRHAEEVKKAREATLKAKQEAEAARKEKEREEAEAAKAIKEAEAAREARKAKETALKAAHDAQTAKEKERQQAVEARKKKEKEEAGIAAANRTLGKTKKKNPRVILIWTISVIMVIVVVGIIVKFVFFKTESTPLIDDKGITNNITETTNVTTSTSSAITTTSVTASTSSVIPATNKITDSLTTTPNSTMMLPSEFVDFNFEPISIDNIEISGNTWFSITLSGNVTCLKDIPYQVNKLVIVPKIIARNCSTTEEVTLNVSNNITAESIPLVQGEVLGFNQILKLQFPGQVSAGQYDLYLYAEDIKVDIGFLVDIADLFQLGEQYLGSLTYKY
jgi:hypothetical protein